MWTLICVLLVTVVGMLYIIGKQAQRLGNRQFERQAAMRVIKANGLEPEYRAEIDRQRAGLRLPTAMPPQGMADMT